MRASARRSLAAAVLAVLMVAPAAAQSGPRAGDPAALPASWRQTLPRPESVVASLGEAQQPAEPPDRFVPVDELPPEEQVPAAPLLIGAYAFVLLALFAYLLSVARRIGAVQHEVDRLERDLRDSRRA